MNDKKEGGMIGFMDEETAKRICVGQVIVNLCGVVKELIENALDAKTTSIGKSHGTSKLCAFNDLENVGTYGFRGEALNALACLSDLTIETRFQSEPVGRALTFDNQGKIVKDHPFPRQVGTSVRAVNLFHNYPVRRKELLKNLNKQWKSLVRMINQYAIICEGVNFVCNNRRPNGKADRLICVSGKSLSSNVEQIGIPVSLPVSEVLPSEQLSEDMGVRQENVQLLFPKIKIKGLLCNLDGLCSTKDNQFVYVNNRPVDSRSISSTVCDVYKQLKVGSRHGHPAFALSIQLPQDEIDINLSPDKSKILVTNEKELLCILKSSVVNALQNAGPIQASISKVFAPLCQDQGHEAALDKSSIAGKNGDGLRNATPVPFSSANDDDDPFMVARSAAEARVHLPRPATTHTRDSVSPPVPIGQGWSRDRRHVLGQLTDVSVASAGRINHCHTLDRFNFTSNPIASTFKHAIPPAEGSVVSGHQPINSAKRTIDDDQKKDNSASKNDGVANTSSRVIVVTESFKITKRPSRPEGSWRSNRKLRFRLNTLVRKPAESQHELRPEYDGEVQADSDQAEAEAQLSQCIKKRDFLDMKVIGQFNLGFIIAELNGHLFVIDQHASDEKYTFETLQKTHLVKTQKLIKPEALNMTKMSENVIIENEQIFERNGFMFELKNENGDQQLLLTGFPVLAGLHFDHADLEELISVLTDMPGVMYRPARFRKIFASRACRSSVMIGRALNRSQMIKIVRNLCGLDHPWTCPHGRPTLRLLHNVSLKFS